MKDNLHTSLNISVFHNKKSWTLPIALSLFVLLKINGQSEQLSSLSQQTTKDEYTIPLSHNKKLAPVATYTSPQDSIDPQKLSLKEQELFGRIAAHGMYSFLNQLHGVEKKVAFQRGYIEIFQEDTAKFNRLNLALNAIYDEKKLNKKESEAVAGLLLPYNKFAKEYNAMLGNMKFVDKYYPYKDILNGEKKAQPKAQTPTTPAQTHTSFINEFASVKEMEKQALILLKNKDYVKAFEYYSSLLSNYPSNPEYNFRFGMTTMLSDERNIDRALRYLSHAAELNPNDPEIFYYLGMAYQRNYNFTEALTAYKKYISLSPKKTKLHSDIYKNIESCTNSSIFFQKFEGISIQQELSSDYIKCLLYYPYQSLWGRFLPVPEQLKSKKDKKEKFIATWFYSNFHHAFFFSSYGIGNNKNIYVVDQDENGNRKVPIVLTKSINSSLDEDFPYITSDGQTLYFASTGFDNLGGYDVFKSTLMSDITTRSSPENLGFPLNTPFNDIWYVPYPKNDSLGYVPSYITSDRNWSYGKPLTYILRTDTIIKLQQLFALKIVSDENKSFDPKYVASLRYLKEISFGRPEPILDSLEQNLVIPWKNNSTPLNNSIIKLDTAVYEPVRTDTTDTWKSVTPIDEKKFVYKEPVIIDKIISPSPVIDSLSLIEPPLLFDRDKFIIYIKKQPWFISFYRWLLTSQQRDSLEQRSILLFQKNQNNFFLIKILLDKVNEDMVLNDSQKRIIALAIFDPKWLGKEAMAKIIAAKDNDILKRKRNAYRQIAAFITEEFLKKERATYRTFVPSSPINPMTKPLPKSSPIKK